MSEYKVFSKDKFHLFKDKTVIHGHNRGGTELGFPTANLDVKETLNLPLGIYFGICKLKSIEYRAVVSVGYCPFYDNKVVSVEAHLLHQFDQDFYGEEVDLLLLGFLRPEKNFNSLELLISAIESDIELAKDLMSDSLYQEGLEVLNRYLFLLMLYTLIQFTLLLGVLKERFNMWKVYERKPLRRGFPQFLMTLVCLTSLFYSERIILVITLIGLVHSIFLRPTRGRVEDSILILSADCFVCLARLVMEVIDV